MGQEVPEQLIELLRDAAPSAGAAFGAIFVLRMIANATRGEPSPASIEEGTLKVSRPIVLGMTAMAMVMALGSAVVTVLFYKAEPVLLFLGPLLTVMMTAFGVGSVLSLTPYGDINWDKDGIEGPSKEIFLGWRVPRLFLSWHEISYQKKKPNGIVNLFNQSGDKVVFSGFHVGHGQLEAAIEHYRPGLPSSKSQLKK